MKKVGLLFVGFVFLFSCQKHEIIPAPEPKVDLVCSFQGLVGGQYIEYTQNVDGYYGMSELTAQTGGGITNVQYHFSMLSPNVLTSVGIGCGSITWNNATGITKPALTLFNSFFDGIHQSPSFDYSNQALNGFEVVYKGVNGSVYYSDENSVNVQNVTFNTLSKESDKTGDYVLFSCDFDCYVYHNYIDPNGNPAKDSLKIEQATFKGWFQR